MIQTTHTETKKELVPALRFKEFGGDWNSQRIESVAHKITSGSRDWAQYYSDSGDKFIRMTNLPKIGINLLLDDLKYVKLPVESSEGKRTSLDSGDVLISITAELGKIGWVPDNLGLAYINQHTALIKLSSRVDSKYVAYQLSTSKNNVKLNRLNDSGAKSGLNLSTIRCFSIPYPTLPEQQKIASFLSSVDQKIEQLTEKKALLEQYKKGIMQLLFSGQLRFKPARPSGGDENGNDYSDWEEKLLGEVSDVSKLAGYEFTKHVVYEEVGKIIALRALNIKNNNLDLADVKYIDNSELSKLNRSKLFIDDMMFTYIGTIGEVALIKEDNRFYLAPNVSRIRFDNSKVVPIFILQYFNHEEFKGKEISKYIYTGTQPSLTMGNVRRFNLKIPCYEEQLEIASYLSSIDTKIESVSNQITQTQTFKKGLLQQMFV